MGGERESLWGERRRPAKSADAGERDDGAAIGTPKERRVLDLQQQAGNAAVAGAVQRSMWGDDDSWLGGVGSMFPAFGGGTGGPDVAKDTGDAGGGTPGGGLVDVGKDVGDVGGGVPGAGGGGGAGGGYKEGEYKDPYGGGGGGGAGGGEGGGYKEGEYKDPYGGGGGKLGEEPYGGKMDGGGTIIDEGGGKFGDDSSGGGGTVIDEGGGKFGDDSYEDGKW